MIGREERWYEGAKQHFTVLTGYLTPNPGEQCSAMSEKFMYNKIVFSSQFFNRFERFEYVDSMFGYFRASSAYFNDP